MEAFNYQRPSSLADAAKALGAGADVKLVAGGQTLLPTMKQGLAAPSDLVDLAGVAELKGNLLDYHVHWDPCYFSETQLFSEHTCVWGVEDFERLAKLPSGTKAGGTFIIVQSHARIPLDRVRDYCLSFAS